MIKKLTYEELGKGIREFIMKKNSKIKEEQPIRLGYYLSGIVALWSILIGLSLVWNLRTVKSGILEAARIEARTAFEKDIVYRRWNADYGGVYAPVTEGTQPNPYLDVSERDITTSLGKKLTLINPAYMTRQVHELALEAYGVRGHITSLNPIRPANAPDPWEIRALKAFQTGLKEVNSVEEVEGNDYMRLMRPLLTEKGCLRCHAAQGYKLGDIRGGISVSIPMAPHMAIGQSTVFTLYVLYGLLWLTGLIGIGVGISRLNQQLHKRKRAEEKLRESRQQLQNLSSQLIEIQEKERKRISLELHDEMGQALTAVELELAAIEKELPSSLAPTIRERLAETRSIVDQASEQIRELSLDLRPSMLDDLGLVPTLRWHLNRFSKRTNVEVKFEAIDLDERLGSDVETVLYRVVQEAINNVSKHAEARKVIVRLQREGEAIAAYVEDDGKGFDANEILVGGAPESGVGVLGMRERVVILGGQFNIQSHRGRGTQISVEIPLN